MKNIIILLSFLSLFLLAGETVMETTLQKESTEYVLPCLVEDEVSLVDAFTSIPNRFHVDMILSDVQSMARQLNVRSGRMFRLNLAQFKWTSKALMRKVTLCKDGLTQQFFHQFTSIPRLSWDVMSDYYVFGIRHILI